MKKIISLLALCVMVVGLAGCLDDPDKSGERPKTSVSLELN